MKKTICLLISLTIFFNLTAIAVSANTDNTEISPYLNNVVSTNTSFEIEDDGTAKIKVGFVGYKNITTGATIRIKIQKRFLLLFWRDVDLGTENNVWVHEVYVSNFEYIHQILLTKGTYRIQVEYQIRGSGGSTDTLSEEIERTY